MKLREENTKPITSHETDSDDKFVFPTSKPLDQKAGTLSKSMEPAQFTTLPNVSKLSAQVPALPVEPLLAKESQKDPDVILSDMVRSLKTERHAKPRWSRISLELAAYQNKARGPCFR